MVHREVIRGNPVALQLALEERPERAYPGLGYYRRFAPELGDIYRDVGGRPPRYRLKVEALPNVSVFSSEIKSTTTSPLVSTSSGLVSEPTHRV
jgi:hypothetical protein